MVLICTSLMISDVEHLFICLFGHVYVFGKISIQVFWPFFNRFVLLMLNYMSYLYILDINPLLVISFANILSHLIGCLFILSMVSFAVLKLLSLIRSQLFIFAFVSFALGDSPKKYCCNLCLCFAYVFF